MLKDSWSDSGSFSGHLLGDVWHINQPDLNVVVEDIALQISRICVQSGGKIYMEVQLEMYDCIVH